MKILLLLTLFLAGCSNKSWREASRDSVGIAARPSELKEDIFQIYYARAFSWRGYFGVHPWVAWKEADVDQYTVAQVTAWNLRRSGGNSSISIKKDLPDRKWFDSEPTIMFELRGHQARIVIEKVKNLIKKYPFKDTYRVWPGPNSNTFVSYLIRNIEELDIELPPHAVGKDYMGPQIIAKSPSGTGFQFSIFGALGLTLGAGEGLEINILGLNFGLDLWTPAIKLPILGRVGFPDKSL